MSSVHRAFVWSVRLRFELCRMTAGKSIASGHRGKHNFLELREVRKGLPAFGSYFSPLLVSLCLSRRTVSSSLRGHRSQPGGGLPVAHLVPLHKGVANASWSDSSRGRTRRNTDQGSNYDHTPAKDALQICVEACKIELHAANKLKATSQYHRGTAG